MASAAPSLRSQTGNARSLTARGLDADTLARRAGQRRRTLALHVASYALGGAILLLYVQTGVIDLNVPVAFFFAGTLVTSGFLVLSEQHINDHFDDHFMTTFLVAAHIAVQLAFMIVAPAIGFAFLGVLFLIFSYGALRMTPRQLGAAWTFTSVALIPSFLIYRLPLGLPVGSDLERLAALLVFTSTIGQCVFVGLYGSSLRNQLYNNGIALKLAYKRIEELAELDELTGAYNRRCVMRLLSEELARAQRLQHPCAIALIDLDWFKRINDSFGHPTGDEVLKTFAITMFANIREIDKFGRYGGEEFLLVLPETTQQAATRMLERLRLIVSDLDWSAFSPDMTVTISAGVASLQPGESPESLLARADHALYAAKGGGRNRIAIA